jgi:hypothetical protein
MFNVIIEKKNSKILLSNSISSGLKGSVQIKKLIVNFANPELEIDLHLVFSLDFLNVYDLFNDAIFQCFLLPLYDDINTNPNKNITLTFNKKYIMEAYQGNFYRLVPDDQDTVFLIKNISLYE